MNDSSSALAKFYASAPGMYRAETVAACIRQMLPEHYGGEAMVLGYAFPFLSGTLLQKAPVLLTENFYGDFRVNGRRPGARNPVAAVDPMSLPLREQSVGVLLAAHWPLSEAEVIAAIARVLIPHGEALLVLDNHRLFDRNQPFDNDNSCSRSAAVRLCRNAGLSVVGVRAACFAPALPTPWLHHTAVFWERFGPYAPFLPAAVHVLHVRKEVYALPPPAPHAVPGRSFRPGIVY